MIVTPIDRATSTTIQENTPTLETDIAISSATKREKEKALDQIWKEAIKKSAKKVITWDPEVNEMLNFCKKEVATGKTISRNKTSFVSYLFNKRNIENTNFAERIFDIIFEVYEEEQRIIYASISAAKSDFSISTAESQQQEQKSRNTQTRGKLPYNRCTPYSPRLLENDKKSQRSQTRIGRKKIVFPNIIRNPSVLPSKRTNTSSIESEDLHLGSRSSCIQKCDIQSNLVPMSEIQEEALPEPIPITPEPFPRQPLVTVNLLPEPQNSIIPNVSYEPLCPIGNLSSQEYYTPEPQQNVIIVSPAMLAMLEGTSENIPTLQVISTGEQQIQGQIIELVVTPFGNFRKYSPPQLENFEFDSLTNYYFDPSTQLYYEPKSGYHYFVKEDKWLFYSYYYGAYIPCEGGDEKAKKELQTIEKAQAQTLIQQQGSVCEVKIKKDIEVIELE
uniref:OCRE domain-containing protein n=1 Tax=Acrobeloides nanus TaxID=290746 RepID=A0A914BYI9_9BILA